MTNAYANAKIQLNGHDRFTEQEEEYFQLRQPYDYHTAVPGTNINLQEKREIINFNNTSNTELKKITEFVSSSNDISSPTQATLNNGALNFNIDPQLKIGDILLATVASAEAADVISQLVTITSGSGSIYTLNNNI